MLRLIEGKPLDVSNAVVKPLSEMELANTLENIEEGQDYEVVIDFAPREHFSLDNYYAGLSDIGTSIQVGEGDGIYRMHIHVPLDKRYTPIEYTESLGTIKKIAMENLQDQVNSRKNEKETIKLAQVTPGQVAVVAVSPGEGLSRIFASLGVAAIVSGGQTMNPSVKELWQLLKTCPPINHHPAQQQKYYFSQQQMHAKVSVKHCT